MRDCGCKAEWEGDQLVIRLCDAHRGALVPAGEADRYGGPPTLVAPHSPTYARPEDRAR